MKMHNKTDVKLLFFSLITASSLLLICSKCSPLYVFNDWVDVHCFVTVGRGIKHGLVPYRDLYEQKGPLLYFIVALGMFFSEDSLISLYIIEVLSFTVFIYYSMKIVMLWTDNMVIYFLAPFIFMTITSSIAFVYGFSAEELCLSVYSYALYIILRRMRKKETPAPQDYFIMGILFSYAFWIKYVLCGFYIGLAMVVFVWIVRMDKQNELKIAILCAILGLLVTSFPILLWYTCKGAFKDLFEVYFYNNIMLYSNNGNVDSTFANLIDALFRENFVWVVSGLFGIVSLLMEYRKNEWEALIIIVTQVMMIVFILLNRYFWTYYPLILAVYSPLALIPLSLIIGKVSVRSVKMRIAILGLTVALSTFVSFMISPNTYMISYTKKDIPQYQFADIMHEKKDNPTLLNYDVLDGGFYYAAGIMPINRFSCKFNIDLPEQMEEQKYIVQDGLVDFVVTRGLASIPGNNYKMISKAGLYSYPGYYEYYLFEKNSDHKD